MGISFISGLAISSAVVVLMTVVASLTLLPALLGFAGERVEVSRWRGMIATGFVALGLVGAGLHIDALALAFPLAVLVLLFGFFLKPLKRRGAEAAAPSPVRETYAYRWSRLVQHHPWPAAIVGTFILVVLALPVLGMRLGFSDESKFHGGHHHPPGLRAARRRLRPGLQRPVLPRRPGRRGGRPRGARADHRRHRRRPRRRLRHPRGAQHADRPRLATSAPTSGRSRPRPRRRTRTPTTLVHRLRDEVLVDGEAALGTNIDVTGQLPATVDFSGYLGAPHAVLLRRRAACCRSCC